MSRGYSKDKSAATLRVNGDDINQLGTTQRAMDSVKGTDYQGPEIHVNKSIPPPKNSGDRKD